jgi:hypothetical protein
MKEAMSYELGKKKNERGHVLLKKDPISICSFNIWREQIHKKARFLERIWDSLFQKKKEERIKI